MKLNDHRAILRLGLPILIGQAGMIIVGFADNIMVGHYSTEALASASLVNNLFNVAFFACVGFTYGLTPIIGALHSRGRETEIGATLRAALAVNALFALAVTAVMAVIYLNLERMGQPPELLPLIRPYFLIFLAGMVPVVIFNVFAQWAYAINLTKMPMWITLAANVVNIAGNYALIYGHWGCPEMGLTGAGWATFASRWLTAGAIIAVFALRRAYAAYRRGFAAGNAESGLARKVWRASWPVSAQMVFESGSFTMAAVMAGWLGAVELASYQIIVITGTLGFCVYYSVASALSVLVSNAAGLSDRRAMRRVAFAGYHIILLLAATASAVFILAGDSLIGTFTTDTRVSAVTLTLITPLVIYQLGDATQITFAGALRGTSNVRPMMWTAAVSYIFVGLPAAYLMTFTAGMGIVGLVLSFSVSLFLAAGLYLWYFLKTTRLR